MFRCKITELGEAWEKVGKGDRLVDCSTYTTPEFTALNSIGKLRPLFNQEPYTKRRNFRLSETTTHF